MSTWDLVFDFYFKTNLGMLWEGWPMSFNSRLLLWGLCSILALDFPISVKTHIFWLHHHGVRCAHSTTVRHYSCSLPEYNSLKAWVLGCSLYGKGGRMGKEKKRQFLSYGNGCQNRKVTGWVCWLTALQRSVLAVVTQRSSVENTLPQWNDGHVYAVITKDDMWFTSGNNCHRGIKSLPA